MGLGIALAVAFPKKVISLSIPQPEHPVLVADYEVADRLYKEWQVAQKKVGTFNPCSCVSYARYKSGLNFPPIGYAKNLVTNSEAPSIGSIIKTNESKYGHLGVVIKIEGDIITIIESNYQKCQVSTRQLKLGDSRIMGFYQ